MLLYSDMLYMLVRYASPSGSMCLRCLIMILSVPVEWCFSLFNCFVDLCCGSVIVVVCSLSVCVECFCLTVLVNCLLNSFTICVFIG